jgi:hypothetical protein
MMESRKAKHGADSFLEVVMKLSQKGLKHAHLAKKLILFFVLMINANIK